MSFQQQFEQYQVGRQKVQSGIQAMDAAVAAAGQEVKALIEQNEHCAARVRELEAKLAEGAPPVEPWPETPSPEPEPEVPDIVKPDPTETHYDPPGEERKQALRIREEALERLQEHPAFSATDVDDLLYHGTLDPPTGNVVGLHHTGSAWIAEMDGVTYPLLGGRASLVQAINMAGHNGQVVVHNPNRVPLEMLISDHPGHGWNGMKSHWGPEHRIWIRGEGRSVRDPIRGAGLASNYAPSLVLEGLALEVADAPGVVAPLMVQSSVDCPAVWMLLDCTLSAENLAAKNYKNAYPSRWASRIHGRLGGLLMFHCNSDEAWEEHGCGYADNTGILWIRGGSYAAAPRTGVQYVHRTERAETDGFVIIDGEASFRCSARSLGENGGGGTITVAGGGKVAIIDARVFIGAADIHGSILAIWGEPLPSGRRWPSGHAIKELAIAGLQVHGAAPYRAERPFAVVSGVERAWVEAPQLHHVQILGAVNHTNNSHGPATITRARTFEFNHQSTEQVAAIKELHLEGFTESHPLILVVR